MECKSKLHYAIDYAGMSTSKCKKCGELIGKGLPRMYRVKHWSDVYGRKKDYKIFYHAVCLNEYLSTARSNVLQIKSVDDIHGFHRMKTIDQEFVCNLWGSL